MIVCAAAAPGPPGQPRGPGAEPPAAAVRVGPARGSSSVESNSMLHRPARQAAVASDPAATVTNNGD